MRSTSSGSSRPEACQARDLRQCSTWLELDSSVGGIKPIWCADLAELFHHGGSHLLHGHHAGEFVGVGEKISFERFCAGGDIGDQGGVGLRDFQEIVGGAEAGVFDGAGDVEHGEAFGHDDGVEVDVAAAEALLNVNDVRRLVEEIFPGLEGAAVMVVVPEDEGFSRCG